MSTSTKNISSDSFGFPSPKSSSLQTTCNICQRLLYSFEEILVCRICQDSYHWRCVKPETISHYGENARFICDRCNDTTTTTTSSHRVSNGGIKIKSPNSSETDYRNFANIPSRLPSTQTKDTTVVNAIRYFEEKQQQQQPSSSSSSSIHKISKSNELDGGYISPQTNGQYTDDPKTIRRIAVESDDENTKSGMFQANYQYTPLKEYAAMKSDTNTNGYKNSSSSPKSEHQLTSSHSNGVGIRYTNKSPTNNSTYFTSPTVDNLTLHNRQQHFISSTNLNVPENSSRYHNGTNYRSSLNYSTPYLSQIRDDENSHLFRNSQQQQQQFDRHSNVGSDSGIVITNPNQQQQPQQQQIVEESQVIEIKLTNLVQQLGRQLETDAQKLSEKLEIKLKNLEYMIHQQTYIIRRQDEVIERLKTKIFKIENERDFFRDRLSVHEQREQDEKKYFTTTQTDESTNRKIYEQDDQQQTLNDVSRKFSTTSSNLTDNSRPSTKKTPAPRADQQGLSGNNDTESALSKFMKTIPTNQEPEPSAPSVFNTLLSSVPVVEKPAASTRLDGIIHQSDTTNSTSPYYNVAEGYKEKQQVSDDETKKNFDKRSKRSSSSSSSTSSSSTSTSTTAKKYNVPTTTTNTILPPRNNNLYRSLESIPRKTSDSESTLRPTNKTASLEFGKRPVGYEDPGSIYITPQEASHPASQYQTSIKGWLRKQNRDSFFKRVERYYCVLSQNILLMHKTDHDTRPQKAINLKGAKVLYYEDQKYGPSLELTWSSRRNYPKHYHLYAPNGQEAQQWVTGIQTAINNLDTRNTWQKYRMQT